MSAKHPGSAAPADFRVLLDKHPGTVLKIIRHLRRPDRIQLSLSCRRCCQLVREALPQALTLSRELGLLLYNNCAHRTWRQCYSLIYNTYSTEDVLCLSAALRHAAKYWPQLQHITIMQLAVEGVLEARDSAAPHAALMAGPFTQLQLQAQLRDLELALPAVTSLTMDLLGCLTQLTRLTLKQSPGALPDDGSSRHAVDCWHLASLVNLRQLQLYGVYPCLPAAAAVVAASTGGAGVLPCSLTSLVLLATPHMERWAPHLSSCSRLQRLHLGYYAPPPGTPLAWRGHPSLLLQSAAPSLPHLTHLQFSCSMERSMAWDMDVGAILRGADHAELVASQVGFHSPLYPVQQMSHLTALEVLALGANMELVCDAPDDWVYLASLPALRHINFVAAGCLPPLGVQLPQLTYLDGWVDDDTLGYVCCAPRFCPRLKELHLTVWEGWELPADADAERFYPATPTDTLRYVQLTCNGDDANSLVGLLQHITPARSLDITWPTYDCDFLPDFSCLPHLTQLVFRPSDFEDGAEEVGHPEHVLGMVLGLVALQELELHNLLLATPRLALALQHEYTQLRLLRLVNCGSLEGSGERGPSDSTQLDRVVRLLRPHLRIEEVGEDEVVVGVNTVEGGQQEAAVEEVFGGTE